MTKKPTKVGDLSLALRETKKSNHPIATHTGMNAMPPVRHYQALAAQAAKLKAREALNAHLAKLSAIPVCIDGVDVVCYVDADDNCEAVMLGDVEISPLLELASCAGDRWWRVLDDHIDTAVSEQNAHDAAANAADRAESIALYERSAA